MPSIDCIKLDYQESQELFDHAANQVYQGSQELFDHAASQVRVMWKSGEGGGVPVQASHETCQTIQVCGCPLGSC